MLFGAGILETCRISFVIFVGTLEILNIQSFIFLGILETLEIYFSFIWYPGNMSAGRAAIFETCQDQFSGRLRPKSIVRLQYTV